MLKVEEGNAGEGSLEGYQGQYFKPISDAMMQHVSLNGLLPLQSNFTQDCMCEGQGGGHTAPCRR